MRVVRIFIKPPVAGLGLARGAAPDRQVEDLEDAHVAMQRDGEDLAGGDRAGHLLDAAAIEPDMPLLDQFLGARTGLYETQAAQQRVEAQGGVQRLRPLRASAKALPGRCGLGRQRAGFALRARRPLNS